MLEEPALVGRVLGGRYRVSSFLGEGAMARVYRATPVEGGEELAVKVMHPDLAEDPTFMRRFRREAKAAACLRHPSVVQVVDFGVDGDLAYIAMECLEGSDLFDILVDEGRLGQARTARLMVQICEALQHAHERGIIHRDLKPENVMVLPERPGERAARVKVLDFGIAKVHQRERAEDMPSVSGSALTNVGSALGTPEYMSPEQCEGIEVDARSDVYSCGAVLYRMLVGRVPFAGGIALDIMLRHLRDPPQPPHEVVPEIDPALEAIVLRALAKQPEDRQQTAAALGAELAALVPALEAREAARPLRLAPSPPRPASRRHSPRGVAVARAADAHGAHRAHGAHGGEARPLATASGDTDPDTVPSQRGGRLRSDEVVLEPEAATDVDILGPAERTSGSAAARPSASPAARSSASPMLPGVVVPPLPSPSPMRPMAPPSPPPMRVAAPLSLSPRPSPVRPPAPAPPSPLLVGDSEDSTLVMPGRGSDPGEGVLTTPFIPRRLPVPPQPLAPPVFSSGVPQAPPSPRPSVPSLPGGDGAAAPVRVVPLFFVTFSIVLVLGMLLLRLVRGF